MQEALHRSLVLDALEMALAARRPAAGLLCHSDRGSQYASGEYQRLPRGAGCTCSMSRRGNCWDNAVVESFFARLKCELVHGERFETRAEARQALFAFHRGVVQPRAITLVAGLLESGGIRAAGSAALYTHCGLTRRPRNRGKPTLLPDATKAVSVQKTNSRPPPDVSLRPTADGSDTLYSPAFGQTFHSQHGAFTEAEQVFLRGTDIEERLAAGEPTSVLEVGLGTGLNFLLTAQRAIRAGMPLRYTALERDLLPADVLARLNHADRLGATALRDALLAWRRGLPEPLPPATYTATLHDLVLLECLVGDATDVMLPDVRYDAVYLDAFSPDANPELWTSAFFERIFSVMKPGGRLATYSAKGAVRRGLAAVGFTVEKRPGPPGKREMLVAVR